MIQSNRSTHPLRSFRSVYWSLALLALIVPAIAMRFSSEVVWDLRDFAAMAVLLTTLGICLEFVLRFARASFARPIGVAVASATAVLLWAELATGRVI